MPKVTKAQFDLISCCAEKVKNRNLLHSLTGGKDLKPGEELWIGGFDPSIVRNELEHTIADHVFDARKYHGPDTALDETLSILDAVLDAYDREVAKAYLAGRNDERFNINDELFKMRVQAFGVGVDCALRFEEEND
jgi:hypothetical protein